MMKHTTLLFALVVSLPFAATCQTPPEPKELLDLRNSFENARTAAVSPIEKKYVDALTGLKDRLAKRGDLQGALAAEAEIARIRPSPPPTPASELKLRLSKFKTTEDFYQWLRTTVWKSTKDASFRFPMRDTLERTGEDGGKGTYFMTIDKVGEVSWTWGNGLKEIMTISSDLKTATTIQSGPLKRIEPQ